jgi:hypothetical protein
MTNDVRFGEPGGWVCFYFIGLREGWYNVRAITTTKTLHLSSYSHGRFQRIAYFFYQSMSIRCHLSLISSPTAWRHDEYTNTLS